MRVMWFAGGFHWISVKGRQALPAEASILTLGPHSSYFDAIPVTMTMASIVMKAESKDIPVWGSKSSLLSCCCLKNKCVCVCVCVCICICICVYTHIHIHIHTHMCGKLYIYIYIYIYIYKYK